jgi:hypothetical protein
MNSRITASNLLKAISSLPKNTRFDYISSSQTKVEVIHVQMPEGPVRIRRHTLSKSGSVTTKEETISPAMLWRIANSFNPNVPINFDRVLGASYNTRSALETLLAHTPEFYVCKPGRVENQGDRTAIKKGHKHLIWLPKSPHRNGVIQKFETKVVISEIPSVSAIYEALTLPDKPADGIDINLSRRHAQIQVALLLIGRQLGFRTHIAKNDHSIVYNDRPLGEMEGVVADLSNEKVISSHEDGVRNARLIDCVWFRNSRFMPAVIEIEQSTGILSGLARMKRFQDSIPPILSRWVIAAPDEDREKVLSAISIPHYESLQAKFFPYSAIEELYSLCQRRRINGVNDDFLDCFMETPN